MNPEVIELLSKLNEKRLFLFNPKSSMILISINNNSSLEKLSLENTLEILNKDNKFFLYSNESNVKKRFLNIYVKSEQGEKSTLFNSIFSKWLNCRDYHFHTINVIKNNNNDFDLFMRNLKPYSYSSYEIREYIKVFSSMNIDEKNIIPISKFLICFKNNNDNLKIINDFIIKHVDKKFFSLFKDVFDFSEPVNNSSFVIKDKNEISLFSYDVNYIFSNSIIVNHSTLSIYLSRYLDCLNHFLTNKNINNIQNVQHFIDEKENILNISVISKNNLSKDFFNKFIENTFFELFPIIYNKPYKFEETNDILYFHYFNSKLENKDKMKQKKI